MFGVGLGIVLALIGASAMDSMDITIPVIIMVIGMVMAVASWKLFEEDKWHE